MNNKIILCCLSLSIVSGCIHKDDSKANYPVSHSVSGYKTLMGSDKLVTAFYQQTDKAAGNDQIFFSHDDLLVNYYASEWANETTQVTLTVNASGNDGNWFTDDDEINYVTKTEYFTDKESRKTHFSSAGNDGMWFTEEDEISHYTISTTTLSDANEKEVKTFVYSAAGIDEVWFTDDDIIEDIMLDIWDTNGRLVESRKFNTGEDNVLNTADDTISKYSYRKQILAEDSETSKLSILETRVGDDGIYNTFDDKSTMVVTQSTEIYLEYENFSPSYGIGMYYAYYATPGEDDEWLTVDDILLSKSTSEILSENERGFTSRSITWLSGANGLPRDTDGEIEKYSLQTVTLDSEGSTDITNYYKSAGSDGIWFTDDDVINYSSVHIYFK